MELSAEILKQYLGFNELAVSPEEDHNCPFDLWGISHKTLYLIKVDDAAFVRGEETVGQTDLAEVFSDLVNFVRSASDAVGVSDRKNTRAIIAELLSRLAHGESDQGIDRLKIMPFILNPLDNRCSAEKTLYFRLLKCTAQPLSLQKLWQEGIPLSALCLSTESKPQELKENSFIDELYPDQNDENSDSEPANADSYRLELITRARQAVGLTSFNLFESLISC